MKTGVCYYPEHWPETRWATDAAHMRRLGLSVVRIGEFAWSRLESADGTLHLDWLERALDTLHAAGLEIVLGTPTATPPLWLLERHPDMLAVDEHGRARGFGSRRHYCFSSRAYLGECARIVTVLAERFGRHPGIVAWQTDNEYGCHDTALSYSDNARDAFRDWCAARYGDIGTLNAAWGNVFWSMEYDDFDRIPLPTGAVTELSPAHRLAFWRFASEEIRNFDRVQTDIIRAHSPGRDVTHNFMGNFVQFDHHVVAEHLDVAAWDSYPLGFLARDDADPTDRVDYLRTGTPDNAAFHHDLYRGCCRGRWWVMEQQPGPVNWAPYNPAPLPGMVRYWGWEALAHGAEVMSWFRWRQAPFAQEQTHTGLLLPDGSEDVGAAEVARLNEELATLEGLDTRTRQAPVAVVFDYAGDRVLRTVQPGARDHDPLTFAQEVHAACRRLGLDVDVVAPGADLDGYRAVLLPNASIDDDGLVARLVAARDAGATIVLFPRTGAKSAEFTIPETLPPGRFRRLIDVRVVRTETLPDFERPVARRNADANGAPRVATTGADGHREGDHDAVPHATRIGQADDAAPTPVDATPHATRTHHWREHVESPLAPLARFDDGWGFHYRDGDVHYVNALPERDDLRALLAEMFAAAGLAPHDLGPGLRLRRLGELRFAFNVGPGTADLDARLPASAALAPDTPLLFGERVLAPAGVAAWVGR